jgi:hypothetical protein
MEQIYKDRIAALGYNHLVCDIFTDWEEVKDEILPQDRKSGSGNGTVHVFLGSAADAALRQEFPAYYQDVENGVDPDDGMIRVKHYFIRSNILSMLGYVCEYYYKKYNDAGSFVSKILSTLAKSDTEDGFLATGAYFRLSTGSSKLRPYFKKFDQHGVFTDLVRQVLIPGSAYKISLYRDSSGGYAAFWLLGFPGMPDFLANPTAEQLTLVRHQPDAGNMPYQVIYYGAPGTGKSFRINRLTSDGNTVRTTFHPDSDYSGFVGSYKPVTTEVQRYDSSGRPIADTNGRPVTESRIIYDFTAQAFLQAYIAAWKTLASGEKESDGSHRKEFLVIEEINRGNCAQIFGDLFQLLDRNTYGYSDYPVLADSDLQRHLAKEFEGLILPDEVELDRMYGKTGTAQTVMNGEILILPCNLYIWATMNTSDQSLFPIDSAFKRRWDWKYIPISEGIDRSTGKPLGWVIEADGKRYSWWSFLQKINAVIGDLTKSQDKKLGYFFCRAENGVISAETFADKVLFYLWNEIFRNFDFDSDFLKDTDGSQLTFDGFYATDETGDTAVCQDKVSLLLENLGADRENAEDTGSGGGAAEDEDEDGTGTGTYQLEE